MNICLLKAEIAKNGLTQAAVARELGLSDTTFTRKLRNGSFGTEEAQKMIRLLEINDPIPIFLQKK